MRREITQVGSVAGRPVWTYVGDVKHLLVDLADAVIFHRENQGEEPAPSIAAIAVGCDQERPVFREFAEAVSGQVVAVNFQTVAIDVVDADETQYTVCVYKIDAEIQDNAKRVAVWVVLAESSMPGDGGVVELAANGAKVVRRFGHLVTLGTPGR